jgi:hypothetical protein
MLIGYGSFALTFALGASGGTADDAAFLTSSTAMADGHTSTATSIKFSTEPATLGQYVEIVVSATSPLDTTAPWGVVGVCNVVGLPEGTKLTFNGVTQRLTYNADGELVAWWIPSGVTGASKSIFIYNDVNGSHSIVPGATFAIGEIFVGRITSLRTLAASSPSVPLIDPTITDQARAGTLRQVMRTPRRTVTGKLGLFTTTQAKGGTASDLPSGGNPAGTIDVMTLRRLLATTNLCAICDTPSAGHGAGTEVNGIRYDQTAMQQSWMIARPLDIGVIADDAFPYWTWNPTWQAAT